jgi:hypothetical protein
MIIPYRKAYIPAFQNAKTQNSSKPDKNKEITDYNKSDHEEETATIFVLAKKTLNNLINSECIENSKKIKMGLDLIG